MENQSRVPQCPSLSRGWSNRVFIVAVIGILFLTLFPFRITLRTRLPLSRSPFLLGGWGKDLSAFDVFLNILLFVPFGFAIGGKFHKGAKFRAAKIAWALALGALLSYGVEFLQLYFPSRDSGWEDVLSNATGFVAGAILFELCGTAVLRLLSESEGTLEELLPWPRATLLVLVYLVLWFAISIPLQKQTRLSNWNPEDALLLGNNVASEAALAWKGELFRLQVAKKIAAGEVFPGAHIRAAVRL
jgi:glycopeptide antibiotics resistance protein